jgi:hypothetical protein
MFNVFGGGSLINRTGIAGVRSLRALLGGESLKAPGWESSQGGNGLDIDLNLVNLICDPLAYHHSIVF